MSIDHFKCFVCDKIFDEYEFYVVSEDDKYICEDCCKDFGITEDNHREFEDEYGYLNNKELIDKLNIKDNGK